MGSSRSVTHSSRCLTRTPSFMRTSSRFHFFFSALWFAVRHGRRLISRSGRLLSLAETSSFKREYGPLFCTAPHFSRGGPIRCRQDADGSFLFPSRGKRRCGLTAGLSMVR